MDDFFALSTYCFNPTYLNYDDIQRALDLISKYEKDPNYIDGIFVTKSDILPDHNVIYKINALDEKKYITMHSDTFKKITENFQLIKEECGIPMFYGVPVKINDAELFEIWINSIIKK